MDKAKLDRLRELAQAATPGPWRVGEGLSRFDVYDDRGLEVFGCYGGEEAAHRARYLAELDPATVLGLLDRIAVLEAAEAVRRERGLELQASLGRGECVSCGYAPCMCDQQ